MSDTSEKAHGTTSCATSCNVCGEAEMLAPTSDEREIDRLRGERDRLRERVATLEEMNNELQRRIAAASRELFSFDPERIVNLLRSGRP